MKSYVKIFGPPIGKTIKALEKIAVKMPEVCIMSLSIQTAIGTPQLGSHGGYFGDSEGINSYFEADMLEERCSKIISKSGESLGEYDFYFEWFETPSMEDTLLLIGKIDAAVTKTGAQYTITTK